MSVETAAPAGVASSLANYTSAALMVPWLREREPAGIIGELGQVLHRQGCLPDVLPLYQSALDQEGLVSSALECGLALPHARLNGVRDVAFALGRTREPVSWGGRGAWPVQLIFLLVIPTTDAARYLQIRASLAGLVRRKDLLESLRTASDSSAMLRVLEKIKLRQG